MKRTGRSKKTGKQYTYYCCEHVNSKDESARCDFMTWDVPVKDDCPVCGHTMFKKAGRGFKRPFCINPDCANFLPEEKRGYPRKKTEDGAQTEAASQTEEGAPRRLPGRRPSPPKRRRPGPRRKRPPPGSRRPRPQRPPGRRSPSRAKKPAGEG